MGILGIEPEWLQTLIMKNYQNDKETLDISKVVEACFARWTEILDMSRFLQAVAGTEYEPIGEVFEKIVEGKIAANVMFLIRYDSDVETIDQYRDVLLSKKRQLLIRNKWGDPIQLSGTPFYKASC